MYPHLHTAARCHPVFGGNCKSFAAIAGAALVVRVPRRVALVVAAVHQSDKIRLVMAGYDSLTLRHDSLISCRTTCRTCCCSCASQRYVRPVCLRWDMTRLHWDMTRCSHIARRVALVVAAAHQRDMTRLVMLEHVLLTLRHDSLILCCTTCRTCCCSCAPARHDSFSYGGT